MLHLHTYLAFNGQCAAAFKHYEKVLGGKIEMMMTHGESPMKDQTPAEWRDRIMHASLVVGDQRLLGADRPPQFQGPNEGFSVSLSLDDAAKAEQIFNGLAEGGTVRMPLQKTFWAAAFGMLIDRFGIPWMVNCEEAGGGR